jgi:hypothetical protein
MVNERSRPIESAYSRSRRAPIAWNVPAQAIASVIVRACSRMTFPTMCSTRRVISEAARREKVSSMIRRGSTLLTIRCATRCASVFVFPEPAPAIIKSGPARSSEHRLSDVCNRSARTFGAEFPTVAAQYDDLARLPRAQSRAGCRRRTIAL